MHFQKNKNIFVLNYYEENMSKIPIGDNMYLFKSDDSKFAKKLVISAHGAIRRINSPAFTNIFAELIFYSKHGNKNTIVITGNVDANGRILNKIGETIEVARNSVDDNKDNHCSHGLHVGSYDYAKDWAGNNGHLMMVEFNPSDAVSVPTDCNFQKLRVSKYKVIGEVPFERIKETEAPLNEPYYNTDEEIDVDDENDCDNNCDCNLNEGYNYSESTILAIRNYVEGRIEAGLPPTLKSIQSRLKGIHITCQDILDICLDLGFTVQDDDDTALSNSVVTIGSESDDQ